MNPEISSTPGKNEITADGQKKPLSSTPKPRFHTVWRYFYFTTLGLGVLALVYYFCATPFVIQLGSTDQLIAPFTIKTYALGEKVTYFFRHPSIGDVVTFTNSLNTYDAPYIGVIVATHTNENITTYQIKNGFGSSPGWMVSRDKILSKIYYPKISQTDIAKLQTPARSTQDPTPTPTLIPITEWLQCGSANQGFTFQYPKTWTVSPNESDQSNSCLFVAPDSSQLHFYLESKAYDSLPIYLAASDKASQTAYEGAPSKKIIESKAMTINGYAVVQRREELLAAGFATTTTYFFYDGQVAWFQSLPADPSVQDFDTQRSYPHIIDSFHFTNASDNRSTNPTTFTTKDHQFSLQYPSDWTLSDESKEVDLYQDGKPQFQHNFTISKNGYSIIFYNPLAWGPMICYFPDNQSNENEVLYGSYYETYQELPNTQGMSLRRVKTSPDDSTDTRFGICSKEANSPNYVGVSGVGTTTYITPNSPDESTLKTMDTIVTSLHPINR